MAIQITSITDAMENSIPDFVAATVNSLEFEIARTISAAEHQRVFEIVERAIMAEIEKLNSIPVPR